MIRVPIRDMNKCNWHLVAAQRDRPGHQQKQNDAANDEAQEHPKCDNKAGALGLKPLVIDWYQRHQCALQFFGNEARAFAGWAGNL